MKISDFTAWIAGFVQVSGELYLTKEQVVIFEAHKNLCVFVEKGAQMPEWANITDNAIGYKMYKVLSNFTPTTEREAAYFIQGFFELSKPIKSKYTKEQSNKLASAIKTRFTPLAPVKEALDIDGVEAFGYVEKFLNGMFKHDIDNSYGLTPEENQNANIIHNSVIVAGGDFSIGNTVNKPNSGFQHTYNENGDVMRC